VKYSIAAFLDTAVYHEEVSQVYR